MTNQLLYLQGAVGFPVPFTPDIEPLDNISGNNTWAGQIILGPNAPNIGVYGTAGVPESSNPSLTIGGLAGAQVTEPNGKVINAGSPYPELGGTVGIKGSISSTSSGAGIISVTVPTNSDSAGLSVNDPVTITGVQGNTAANSTWTIQNIVVNGGTTTFQLVGSNGNGTYVNGTGTWFSGVSGTTASPASPIEITTAGPNGLSSGETVFFIGMSGDTALNGGIFPVTVIDSTHFTVNSTTSNGTYTSGGTWVAGLLNGTTTFDQSGNGTLILTTPNTFTGTLTVGRFGGGVVELEDSKAVGLGGSAITVNNGATLELAVDFRLANNLAPTDSLTIPNTITITGNGWNTGATTLGALYSHDGINSVTGTFRLNGGAAIGVDATADPTGAPYNYNVTALGQPLDDSLMITGQAGGIPNGTLTKVGQGQLILPTANSYTGGTNIQAGVVTIENSQSLGSQFANESQNNQPSITVANNAALHLLPLSATPVDEQQTITFGGTITGGTFFLSDVVNYFRFTPFLN